MSGKNKVTMFNMNTHVSRHLIEKVDKAAYHDAVGYNDDDEDEEDE